MRGKRIRGVLVKFSVAVRLCLGGSTNTGGWAPQSETQINHRINQPHDTGRARQTAIFSAKLWTEENSQNRWLPRSANQIKTNKKPKQLTNATKEANKASKQPTYQPTIQKKKKWHGSHAADGSAYLHRHERDQLRGVVEDVVRAGDQAARVQRKHAPGQTLPLFQPRHVSEPGGKEGQVPTLALDFGR